jgi:hypothetical protein
VLDGVVWSEHIAFAMFIRGWNADGTPDNDIVGGSATSESRLILGVDDPHWGLHPEYTIWWPANLPNEVSLEFTPFADPDEIHRLMYMNFSCLTRWAPCRDKKDIMPVALARKAYWTSLPYDPDVWAHQCSDPLFLELCARDSPDILLLEVSTSQPVRREDGQENSREHILTLRIQEVLKARAKFDSQAPLKLLFLETTSREANKLATRGGRMILFFRDVPSFESMDGCSPMAPTPANLTAIRRGIAEDTRPVRLSQFDFWH